MKRTNNNVFIFMDRLSDFLGSSDGEDIVEVRRRLAEEMGVDRFMEAERDFLIFLERVRNYHQEGEADVRDSDLD